MKTRKIAVSSHKKKVLYRPNRTVQYLTKKLPYGACPNEFLGCYKFFLYFSFLNLAKKPFFFFGVSNGPLNPFTPVM